MAKVTGRALLDGVLSAQQVNLSVPVSGALAMRLEQALSAGASDVQMAAVLAALSAVRDSVGPGGSVVSTLAQTIRQTRAEIADGDDGGDDGGGGGSQLAALAQARSHVDSDYGTLATASTKYVGALLTGDSWGAKKNLTYSFESVMPAEYRYDYELSDSWRPLSATEQAVVRSVYAELNSLLGVRISEVASGGDMRFSSVYMQDSAGFAYTPDGSSLGGDVWLDRSTQFEPGYYDVGGYGYQVITHEIGHAMGLDHPFEGRVTMPDAVDNVAYTVMTYNSEVRSMIAEFSVSQSGGRISFEGSLLEAYRESFSLVDVHTLQHLYGANASTRTGNDVYTVDTQAGEYLTIWDAGGVDTIDVSSVAGRSSIDLRSGSVSSVGQRTIEELIQEGIADLVAGGVSRDAATDFVRDFLGDREYQSWLYTGQDNLSIVQGVWIENVRTGAGNDQVWDNAVDNRITTGAGNDKIYLGAGGFDYVDAGTGNDTVVLGVARSKVQYEQDDQGLLLVADNFAARLVGVEQVQFSDYLWTV